MALDNGHADWAGTRWHEKDVPAMWELVRHHTPDAYAAHLAGWRRTSELLSQHIARMTAYRDNLSAAWNPHHSPAAAVYLTRFDADIDNARRTLDASVANYAAYAAAMHVVSEARTALEPIEAEYAANAAAEEAHRKLVGSIGHRGGTTLVMTAPDVGARQAELTGLARAAMYRASQELIEATAALQIPPAYEGIQIRDNSPSDGSIRPPQIKSVQTFRNSFKPRDLFQETVHEGGIASIGQSLAPRGPALQNAGPQAHQPFVPDSFQEKSIPTPAQNASPPAYFNNSPIQPGSSIFGRTIGAPPPGPGTREPIGKASSPENAAGAQRPSSREGVITPPLMGNLTGQAQKGDTSRNLPNDPDSIWATSEGVSPVILPDSSLQAIDPGPAIGLDKR